MLRLFIVALCAIVVVSCRNAPAPDEATELQPQQIDAPQSSGKTLTGEYFVKPAEDDYAILQGPQALIRFDADGNFRRERLAGDLLVEEGGYILSTNGELVLFVEKAGDEQMTSARLEKYLIVEQSELLMKLQADRAGSFILEKK